MNTPQHVLATDLDGTLIPLDNDPQNANDLTRLQQALESQQITLCFVTGRHLESVQEAIATKALPSPDWIICDVGTTILRRDQQQFEPVSEYCECLAKIVGEMTVARLQTYLTRIEGLRLQEQEKQGPYKFSFYCAADQLSKFVEELEARLRSHSAPYSIIHSVDPFNGDGLIDLLPQGVSKAYALDWWCKFLGLPHEQVVFAGDSGNDLAAFVSGFKSIVVGNTPETVAEQVRQHHAQQGWTDRMYRATASATSGVLEGCRWFGLIDDRDN